MVDVEVAVAEPPPPLVEPAPVDPIVVAATTSPAVRRGLSTRRALELRSQHTRILLGLWQRLEKYLANPQRPLGNRKDPELLERMMRVVRKGMAEKSAEFRRQGEIYVKQ